MLLLEGAHVLNVERIALWGARRRLRETLGFSVASGLSFPAHRAVNLACDIARLRRRQQRVSRRQLDWLTGALAEMLEVVRRLPTAYLQGSPKRSRREGIDANAAVECRTQPTGMRFRPILRRCQSTAMF
jgi:hypothetical protein